jgi:hypothetical protein
VTPYHDTTDVQDLVKSALRNSFRSINRSSPRSTRIRPTERRGEALPLTCSRAHCVQAKASARARRTRHRRGRSIRRRQHAASR